MTCSSTFLKYPLSVLTETLATYIFRGGSRGRGEKVATPPPPPLGSFQTCLATQCLYLFHSKNNIISYNVSSSSIDHYKKTVAIPLLDSLIIQMQDRFSVEDRHARHLLCAVPSIIVNKALQLDDEVKRRAVLGERYSISQIPWK